MRVAAVGGFSVHLDCDNESGGREVVRDLLCLIRIVRTRGKFDAAKQSNYRSRRSTAGIVYHVNVASRTPDSSARSLYASLEQRNMHRYAVVPSMNLDFQTSAGSKIEFRFSGFSVFYSLSVRNGGFFSAFVLWYNVIKKLFSPFRTLPTDDWRLTCAYTKFEIRYLFWIRFLTTLDTWIHFVSTFNLKYRILNKNESLQLQIKCIIIFIIFIIFLRFVFTYWPRFVIRRYFYSVFSHTRLICLSIPSRRTFVATIDRAILS